MTYSVGLAKAPDESLQIATKQNRRAEHTGDSVNLLNARQKGVYVMNKIKTLLKVAIRLIVEEILRILFDDDE